VLWQRLQTAGCLSAPSEGEGAGRRRGQAAACGAGASSCPHLQAVTGATACTRMLQIWPA
jgi:hypothetical protein